MEVADIFDNNRFIAIVSGALKNTIKSHGPISEDKYIPSASKRIAKGIMGELKAASIQNIKDAAIKAKIEDLQKEIDRLRRKCITAVKTANHWREKNE